MDLAALESLSARQAECLRLVARDRDAKEIGRILGISDETVERHIKLAMRKLGASSRFSAARALAESEGRAHPMVMPLQGGEAAPAAPAMDRGDVEHATDAAVREELREDRVTFDHLGDFPGAYPFRLVEVRNRLSVPVRLMLCVAAFLVLAVGVAGVGSAMQELSGWMHASAVAHRNVPGGG